MISAVDFRGVSASQGRQKPRQPSLQGDQKPVVVKDKLEDCGERVSEMWYFFPSVLRHQKTNTQLFTCRLPFLSPKQQCQSPEGNTSIILASIKSGMVSFCYRFTQVVLENGHYDLWL